MNITQKPINNLTNEEFIEAYKENKIKFRLQGSKFTFEALLQICFQNEIISEKRAIELKELYNDNI